MSKAIIEVKYHTPPVGKEYEGNAWPGPGIYQIPSTLQWFVVYQAAGGIPIAMNLGTSASSPFPMQPYAEPTLEAVSGASISANDLLKAIAISQSPELAKELCK